MSLSYKVSKLILIALVVSMLFAVAVDFSMYLIFEHDLLTQVYMAGNYLANIPADAERLAEGVLEPADDDKVFEEFETFFRATYGHKARGKMDKASVSKGVACRYTVNAGLIQDIWGVCRVINEGGVKGVEVTLCYDMEPVKDLIGEADGSAGRLGMSVSKTRRFRLIGM